MKITAALGYIGMVALLTACATITRGENDTLVINTSPAGAQVAVNNGKSCTSTPCAIEMPRRSEVVLTITKARCTPVQVGITHKTADGGSAAMAGNVLVGGIIGLAVDASTGATQDLVPNPVNVTLQCR